MRRAFGVVGGATFALLLAGVGAAGAQVYPPTPPLCSIQLSASAVRADQTFTVTGTQGGANVPVEIEFESTPVVIANATTDASGEFSVQATVPAAAEPGSHVVRANGNTTCTAEVRVEGAAAPIAAATTGRSVGPSLAFTGANTLAMVLFALVVLTVGAALVGGERRQRSRRANITRERRLRRVPGTPAGQ